MKKITFIFLILIIPYVAQADNGVKRETVEHLLKVTNAEAIIDSAYSEIENMFKGIAKELGVKKSEQPIFDNYMLKVALSMKQEMTWEKMKEPMIDVYMKHYTKKEINDLLIFYKTSTGKALIEKAPIVMKDTMVVTQSMFKDFIPKIKLLSEEFKKEIEKHRRKNK